MKFDYHGKRQTYGRISPLVDYLKNADGLQKWDYMGLIVEIDPTVDFKDQNVLIRWQDVDEGFNDKIIVNSLEEFQFHFSKIEL
jgi:hypothetical protein